MTSLEETKNKLFVQLEKKVADGVLEPTNAELLKKHIGLAESSSEAEAIFALGAMYKKTGLYYDVRLEKEMTNKIHYFKKNNDLSFVSDSGKPTHKLIIGDNYVGLENLLISYKGAVDVIYIDPPYGKDSLGQFAETNYDNSLSRDNLLSMLRFRLDLAKQLMSEQGVIYCSIDDKNQAYVKCLFDDVFGEKNYIACLPTIMNLKGNQDEFGFAGTHEYTLVYANNKSLVIFNQFLVEDDLSDWKQDEIGYYKKGATLKRTGVDAPRERRAKSYYPILIKEGRVCSISEDEYLQIYNPEERSFDDVYVDMLINKYTAEGYAVILPKVSNIKASWRWGYYKVSKESHNLIVDTGEDGQYVLYKKQRPSLGDLPSKKPKSVFYKPEYSSGNGTSQLDSLGFTRIFNNPKPVELIKDFIYLASRKESLILDFFAGSGTTAHAVGELNRMDGGNRTCILCQLNEITNTTPNGIAYDVTSKRVKRIMTGECYNGFKEFSWIDNNVPYGENLEVFEIVSSRNDEVSVIEDIDESLYGEHFDSLEKKIDWICSNFQNTQNILKDRRDA